MNTDFPRPWLKQYPDFVQKEALERWDTSLAALLDRAAEESPERCAIIYEKTQISYAALREKAEQFAASLQKLGFKQGDRVAIMLPNLPQMIIAFWGVVKAGGVMVMMNPLYKEKEIIANLTDAGAEYIVLQDLLWPRIDALRTKLPLHTYIVTNQDDCVAFTRRLLQKFTKKSPTMAEPVPCDGKQIFSWSQFFALDHDYFPPNGITGDTPLLLQYTGGTTGTSKGVILTHGNMGTNAMQIRQFFNLSAKDQHIFLDILPFFHVYGLSLGLIQPVATAATALPLPRFDPRETLQTIAAYRPTIFPSAPAIYISLLKQKELANYDLKSIRICMSGSAPLPQELFKRFQEITGASILEGYGLTEASPVTHFIPLGAEGTRERSIGLPLPGTDARIVDMDAGALTLEPGKRGELVIRGPQVMQGYLNNPDETASALRNGWLYTGDIAMMDEDGYFYIVDRKKDMAIVGGYNVFPREVDEVLMEHPKIHEAVCVGLRDDVRGEVLKAYIVPKAGETLTKSEIVGFCRSKLASYKVPRQIEFRQELPRSIVGKILRRYLRDEEEMAKKQSGPEA
ncbi:MAG: long-chain fatty acid--CoA ligase [Desulfovibrio sp.]|nr:long-chain fatty acid--CoA ligase [Desulfovibrio sp.]